MLVRLMEVVEKLDEKLDLANKKQDEAIGFNTTFRQNTVAVLKVFGAIAGSGALGTAGYFLYNIVL